MLGLGPKSRTAFIRFLVDREPTEHEAALLADLYGWPSQEDTLGVEPKTSAPDLATALMALAGELRAAREERQALRQEVDALRALVGQLAEGHLSAQVLAGPGARAAHGQSAESS